MNIMEYINNKDEKPLDKIAPNGGFCGIFRTIACIGDSLSSGEFVAFENGNKSWHDMYEYSWGQFLARDTGCTVYNFSKGGMSAKCYDGFARENGFYDQKYRSKAYIIALGVNDVTQVLAGETEFGDIEDIDKNDYAKNKPTFVGYYASIISKYKAIEPKAKFFFVTAPVDFCEEKRKVLHDKHREVLYKLTEIFDNSYVIDLREYAPPYDEEFKKKFYLDDHMNPMGYRLTALMIESYIDYIIRNNFEDFKQVGFIGTAHHNAKEKW